MLFFLSNRQAWMLPSKYTEENCDSDILYEEQMQEQ